MAAPTHGGTSGEQTSSSWTHTAGANTKGIQVRLYTTAGYSTGVSHQASAVTYGNKPLTKVCDATRPGGIEAHICTWALADITGRDDDVVRVTGPTWGTGANQYRGRSTLIDHASSAVAVGDAESNAASNGSTDISVTLDPGSGIPALSLGHIAARWFSNTGDPSSHSVTDEYQYEATCCWSWVHGGYKSHTGSTTFGWGNWGAGVQGQAMGAVAWVESTLVTQTGSFTANAFIRGYFTANAALKAARTGSLTANATKLKTQAGSLTANSVRKKNQSGSFTLDAVFGRGGTVLLNATRLKTGTTGSFTANAVIAGTRRPTFQISTQIITSGTSFTPPATARGMFVFVVGQPNGETAGFTHTMTGVTFGGVALTGPTTANNNSAHMDGFYLDNYSNFTGRSGNSLVFSGGTMGTVQTTYRGYIVWVLHPTHAVTMASITQAASDINPGQSLTATPTPGTGVECNTLVPWINANGAVCTPQAGQTALLTDGVSLVKKIAISWRNVTGSVAVGYDCSSDSGFNRVALVPSAWKQGTQIQTTVTGSFTANAFIQPYFRADAVIKRAGTTGSFAADAWFQRPIIPITVDAFILRPGNQGFLAAFALLKKTQAATFTLNAETRRDWFPLSAYLDTLHPTGSFTPRAWIHVPPTTVTSDELFMDAWIDSALGEQFTIDATFAEPTRVGSFSADADLAPAGEHRASLSLDALRRVRQTAILQLAARIETYRPGHFTLDAIVPYSFRADAALVPITGEGDFSVDSVVSRPAAGVLGASALIVDATGFHGISLDAVLRKTFATTTPDEGIALIALIAGAPTGSFSLSAKIASRVTVDAFVQPYFRLDAYLGSSSIVLYPASQEGCDASLIAGVLSTPTGEFDASLVGSIVVIDDADYQILSVIDATGLTVDPPDTAIDTELCWRIPSGAATDAIGNEPPPVGRAFRLVIKWRRPNAGSWTDITGDVLWARATFTQTARTSAGTFECPLLGSFDEFIGGEELVVEVDDYRVFGGYVLSVERGYVFPDDLGEATTVLRGADYGVILDRQIVYNAAWEENHGSSGQYKGWPAFAQGTSDQEIIKTIGRRFMSDPEADGYDFHTYIDEVDTPAPTTKWTMGPGTTLRTVLGEISRITGGVWWMDAYKNLHYHDRSTITGLPVTDGDSGVSSRELEVSTDLSVVANDVFVWGTQAFLDTGDSQIIYSRQTADRDWDVDWWTMRIAQVQARIDAITDIPAGSRTAKQKSRLGALRRTRDTYRRRLREAEAHTEVGSVERIGRWQYGEFRQDIYHQRYLDRRARAIMERYSEPVVHVNATVFDPGFAAGQVCEVVSIAHDIAEDLVIREMTITFAVSKEPFEGRFYAVPRYGLSLGLDPEEPWDIYEYLPFPAFDYQKPRFWKRTRTPDGGDDTPRDAEVPIPQCLPDDPRPECAGVVDPPTEIPFGGAIYRDGRTFPGPMNYIGYTRGKEWWGGDVGPMFGNYHYRVGSWIGAPIGWYQPGTAHKVMGWGEVEAWFHFTVPAFTTSDFGLSFDLTTSHSRGFAPSFFVVVSDGPPSNIPIIPFGSIIPDPIIDLDMNRRVLTYVPSPSGDTYIPNPEFVTTDANGVATWGINKDDLPGPGEEVWIGVKPGWQAELGNIVDCCFTWPIDSYAGMYSITGGDYGGFSGEGTVQLRGSFYLIRGPA